MAQHAHRELPFGDVGASGTGGARGFVGFKAFSHERALLRGDRLLIANRSSLSPPARNRDRPWPFRHPGRASPQSVCAPVLHGPWTFLPPLQHGLSPIRKLLNQNFVVYTIVLTTVVLHDSFSEAERLLRDAIGEPGTLVAVGNYRA